MLIAGSEQHRHSSSDPERLCPPCWPLHPRRNFVPFATRTAPPGALRGAESRRLEVTPPERSWCEGEPQGVRGGCPAPGIAELLLFQKETV